MFRKELKIFRENQQGGETELPLQTRIRQSLYASLLEFEEDDSMKKISKVAAICGENTLDIHQMQNSTLLDPWNVELGAQEPWPQPIHLYRPYEVEQILLPDSANCLAVQAYLKMCNLDFTIEPRWNAEYMSPSGKVPFIKCGAFVVPDFDNIVSFISSRGASLSESLSEQDKVNLRAYQSLVNNVLYNAELYVCWCHEDTYKNITKNRHGSVYPWPLNHLLNWQKRNQITKRLNILGYANKSLKEIFDDVKKCCEALSERLEDKTYFFGDNPNELDALVFSHVHTLTRSNLPSSIQELAEIIRRYPLLIDHAYLINKNFFNRTPNLNIDSFEVIEVSSDEYI